MDEEPDVERPAAAPREGQIQPYDAGWNAHRVGLERSTVEALARDRGWALLGYDSRHLSTRCPARRKHPISSDFWVRCQKDPGHEGKHVNDGVEWEDESDYALPIASTVDAALDRHTQSAAPSPDDTPFAAPALQSHEAGLFGHWHQEGKPADPHTKPQGVRQCPHGVNVGPLDDYGVADGDRVFSTYCEQCHEDQVRPAADRHTAPAPTEGE
jgi:hypothetical protein